MTTRLASLALALSTLGATSAASAGGPTPLPESCERRHDGLYENREPATIDKLGDRYVLTLRCAGVHQIYVRTPGPANFEALLGRPVCARYAYVEQASPQTRCIRAPCPPATERVIDIARVEEPAAGATPGCHR